MRRWVVIAMAVCAMQAMPASATSTETHQPPWDGYMCTPVQVSVGHIDIVRTGGCTLPNLPAQAGFATSVPAGTSCPPQHGLCANVTPSWGNPTDTYSAPRSGTGRIDVVGSPGVCINVGTRGGDSTFGSGCGSAVTFTVPGARQVVVTMRGPGWVGQLTYTFPV